METSESHPFIKYKMDEHVNKLYIGTFPPYRLTNKKTPDLNSIKLSKNDVCFFYGSNCSLFWPILELASGYNFNYEKIFFLKYLDVQKPSGLLYKERESLIEIDNRKIFVKILQSPTGQVLGNPLNLIELINQYKKELIEDVINS
jgi:hypothetical protein